MCVPWSIALCWLMVVSSLGSGAPRAAASSAQVPAVARSHVPRQVVVRFAPGTGAATRAAARAAVRASRGRRLGLPGAELLVLRDGMTVRRAIRRLRGNPAVRYAEANAYATSASLSCPATLANGAQCIPDDPRFDQQYDLDNRGQTVNGGSGTVFDADIDAVEAWNITRGSGDVVVAVVDSGIAYDNPDLARNLWQNPGELGADAAGRDKRSNGTDDDRNGYVDDWRGWDVVGRSVIDPGDSDNDPRDISGHGTHVAGTLGARTHNATGVAGLNWDVRIMNVRVRAERSNETSADIADAFVYAARNGARVVNASLSERDHSQYLQDAIAAYPRVLFVVAAGNDGLDLDSPGNDRYPCEYPGANLICVGATGRADELASWSNRGGRNVDIAAPGMLLIGSQPAYAVRHTEGFATDPFAAPARWLRGARPGYVNDWGLSTTYKKSGSHSLTNRVAGPSQPGSDTWVELATPFDLRGRLGCELRSALWLSTDAGSGLYFQARADPGFMAPSTSPAQDTPTPSNDTIAYLTGTRMNSGLRLNISDLDGRAAAHLRIGMLQGASTSAAPRAWLDDLTLRCLSPTYSANGIAETNYMAGTSMATPHVAGVAALMLAKTPSLTVAELRQGLLRAVDVKADLAGRIATAGRLNAYKALSTSTAVVGDGVLRVTAGRGQTNHFTVSERMVNGKTRYHVADSWTPWGQSPMAGSRIVPGAGCASVNETEVACDGAGIASIVIDTRDLADSVDADGVGVPVSVRHDGDAQPAPAPAAVTGEASGVSHAEAILHGTVEPRGQVTSYRFEWGTDSGYGQATPWQDAGSDDAAHAVSATLAGLRPATTYHFRIVARSATETVHGADRAFTTPAPPDASPYESVVLGDGPVSYWRLGEATGAVAADRRQANPGRYAGTVGLGAPGAVAGDAALRLAGTGYVAVADSASLDTGDSFSLEAWVKPARLGATQGIAAKGTSYMVFIDSANRLVLRKPNAGVVAVARTAIADTGRFHHVVVTKSGSAVRLYLDGRDVTGTVTNRTVADSTGQLVLGAGAAAFKGVLDEVAVYDEALAPADVAEHHAAAG